MYRLPSGFLERHREVQVEQDSRLKSLAERAAAIGAGLPSDVRPGIVVEVFRLLISSSQDGASMFPEVRSAPPPGLSPLPETVGEHLATLRSLSHPERLVAIASFRYRREGTEALTAAEFLDVYSETRTPRPQNLHANLARSIQRGWLVPTTKDGQKAWRVTQRGLTQIDEMKDREEA
jgi:hypothetical protein